MFETLPPCGKLSPYSAETLLPPKVKDEITESHNKQRLIRDYLRGLSKMPIASWNKQSKAVHKWYDDCIDKFDSDNNVTFEWP